MRQTVGSSPKRNPSARDEAEPWVKFCDLKEGVSSLFKRTAGKVLLLSDETSFSAVAFAARMPRAVSVVAEDALPLFAMPDGGGILAAGGEKVLRAARLYATLKGIPCMLFPAECGLGGAFEASGAWVDGTYFDHPLSGAEVCIDENFVLSSRAEGYARLLLCRLALFERCALFRFHGGEEPSEEAFRVLSGSDEPELREIVLKNAALRRLDSDEGEGKFLAETYGNFAAFEALIALYVAFFRHGSPRKFVVPDYAARAEAAHVPFADVAVPTEELYTKRALTLSGRRAEFLRELELISRKNAIYRRVYRSFGGRTDPVPLSALRTLPERSNGLSAIVRDFGLMEKL